MKSTFSAQNVPNVVLRPGSRRSRRGRRVEIKDDGKGRGRKERRKKRGKKSAEITEIFKTRRLCYMLVVVNA